MELVTWLVGNITNVLTCSGSAATQMIEQMGTIDSSRDGHIQQYSSMDCELVDRNCEFNTS